MNRLLASVNTVEEALMAQQNHVDIIDLKQPKFGALGALEPLLIEEIVRQLNHASLLSATIGDLPMQANRLCPAVEAMANKGVDYIKIGFFPADNWQKILDALQPLSQQLKLIAVLFADHRPNIHKLTPFADAGFNGVMLDTADKSQGRLTGILSIEQIQKFVVHSQSLHLLSGLAGSLRATDIALLKPLNADYLGFRGALCQGHQRTEKLDLNALQHIKAQLC